MRVTLPFLLASTASALPSLSRKQVHDPIWNDEYIPQPQNFQIRNAGARCDFQLVYERFAYDSRYSVDIYASYLDGGQTEVIPIGGTLARDNVLLVDGLADNRAYQVNFFRDICKFGSAPRSFTLNFHLDPPSGYTYENNWTSGDIPITEGTLPGVPQNVRVQVAARDSTVFWDEVPGASGYLVVVEWYTNSEVGEIPFVWTRALGADARSFNYNRRFSKASVLAIGDDGRAFTSLAEVGDITPS